jgi:hypothetical protein
MGEFFYIVAKLTKLRYVMKKDEHRSQLEFSRTQTLVLSNLRCSVTTEISVAYPCPGSEPLA